jgi:uncharacterized membrane protein YbhN (UPF0104 family)
VVPATVALAAVGLLTTAAAAENSDVAGSLKVLAHLRWIWLGVGIALEVVSVAAFAAMFRELLKAGRVRPRWSETLTTVYAANAMSVTVPLAGPGLAAAYLFRRFARFGAGAVGAGWALLAGGVISTIAWVVVLAAGGLASGRTVALAITVPALALAVAVAAAIVAAVRYPRPRRVLENLLARALAGGARLLRWPATDPKLALRAWAQRFGALRLPTSHWALAFGYSLLNWFTDAAVLTVGIVAVGAHVPWHDLLLVYAAGIGAQGLSLTPGGLAITEGAISLALVASGVHVRQAVAAAVVYRLISFWFNAALGWLILLVLQARRPAAQAAPEPALEPSAEPVPEAAPQPHELVLLHGQPGSAADWDAVLDRLPAHLHAVAKDRPGYGASLRNAGGFTANAQVILDDLDERGLDAAILVAHSWAGGAALTAAHLAPHRVKAVVLLAGVGPGSVGIVDWLLAAPVIGPLAAQVMWRWTPWIARVRLAWLSGREGRPLEPGEHLSFQVWGEKPAGAEPRWRAFLTEQRALLGELAELEGALPSIGVPVLLLADPADQIVPIMTAQRLASELPRARLRLISDAGHHLPRRAPGAVVEAIADFVAVLDEDDAGGLGAGRGDEAGLVGDDHELGPVTRLELQEQPAHVRLRGRGAEVQPLGDLPVGPAPGHQREHLSLTAGKDVEAGRRRPVAVRAAHEFTDELAGDARCEQRVAGGHDPDPGQQVGGRRVFEQEAAGASPQRGVDVLVEIEGGKDEHLDVPGLPGPADQPGSFQPVQVRHPDVHEDDIGLCLPRQRDRLGAVAGLTDDLEVRRGVNEHAETAAYEGLVVGHDNADHPATLATGKQARTRKPPSGPGPAANSPPNTATRSRIPMIPCPETVPGPGPRTSGAAGAWLATSTVTESPV